MNKKNIATTMATLLCACLFIVIGSCFSAFLYKNEIIKVKDPKVFVSEGMSIFNQDGDKTIEKLELSTMKLGLKPATGEEDATNNIPTTVTDKQGSEGVYAKFKLYTPDGAKVVIRNINIDSNNDKQKVEKERENICVAIKELENSKVDLVQESVTLGSILASNERLEYTLIVWLCGKTGEDLEGATISFDLVFEKLT